jgi:hypothetical protein
MKHIILRLFRSLRIIIPYTDPTDDSKQHYFNVLNPLGWIILIIWGFFEGLARWYQFIHFAFADAIRTEKSLMEPTKTPPVEASVPQKVRN